MGELYTPDYDWVTTRHYRALHHAMFTREQAKECEEDGGYYEPVKLACGQTAPQVHIPGVFSRGGFGGGLPRCVRCCKVTGLPEGNGSPKNDDECRRILGMETP